MRVPVSRRLVPAAVLAAAACAGAAACSSGSSSAAPEGLSGTEAGVAGNSPYAAENAAAATSLTPAPGRSSAGKTTVTVLGSTTPANGDINPYAIWPVTETVGSVKTGDVLVDNFNNASNNQGTGTTIVDMHPDGQLSVFASLPAHHVRLPRRGRADHGHGAAQDRLGHRRQPAQQPTGRSPRPGPAACSCCPRRASSPGTIAGSYLDGPWDETVKDNGSTATLFVTNTLIGITASTQRRHGRSTRATWSG